MAKPPTTTTAPTGHIAPFGLRMLPELRQQIEAAAKVSGRSMNAEVVARLQSSFDRSASSEAVATLAAELAKAKRDVAHAAYGRQDKLIQLVLLYDIFRDLASAADALGLEEILPRSERDVADTIGWEANDEVMRQEKDHDPFALFDGYKISEQELQAALSKLASVVVDQPAPSEDGAQRLQGMRDRIRKRREREHAEGKYIRDPSNEPTLDEVAPSTRKPSAKPKR